MLLQHIKSIEVDAEAQTEYDNLVEYVNSILNKMEVVLEAAPMRDHSFNLSNRLAGQIPSPTAGASEQPEVMPTSGNGVPNMPAPGQVEAGGSMEEVMASMETVMKQMDAAKRGLGLVNKLSDSPSRTQNRSRVMGNLNRIRANVGRIEKMLASMQ